MKSTEPRIQKPLAYTKNQLIKKLKEDGNYNADFVRALGYQSDYVWKRGDVYELYNCMGDKARDTYENKVANTIQEILIELDPTEDIVAKREAFDYIEGRVYSAGYSDDDAEAVLALLWKGTKYLTADEIYDIDYENVDFEKTGNEYISISVGASVWSFYVSGTFTTGNKKITNKNVSLGSTATRL